MDAKRFVVPGALVLLLGGYFAVHTSHAAPDPANDQRRAALEQCPQRFETPYTSVCLPTGWKAEGRPPGNDPMAPNIETTERVIKDQAGFRIHLNGAGGIVAQVALLPQSDLDQAAADQLDSAPDEASRHAAIAGMLTDEAAKQQQPLSAAPEFLPTGTVPHADVAVTMSGQFPAWFIFRSPKRFKMLGLPGPTLPLQPTDMALVQPAAQDVLQSWAWADDWQEAPDAGDLLKEILKKQH